MILKIEERFFELEEKHQENIQTNERKIEEIKRENNFLKEQLEKMNGLQDRDTNVSLWFKINQIEFTVLFQNQTYFLAQNNE